MSSCSTYHCALSRCIILHSHCTSCNCTPPCHIHVHISTQLGLSELTWLYVTSLQLYLGVFLVLFTTSFKTVQTALRFSRRLRCPLPLLFSFSAKSYKTAHSWTMTKSLPCQEATSLGHLFFNMNIYM